MRLRLHEAGYILKTLFSSKTSHSPPNGKASHRKPTKEETVYYFCFRSGFL